MKKGYHVDLDRPLSPKEEWNLVKAKNLEHGIGAFVYKNVSPDKLSFDIEEVPMEEIYAELNLSRNRVQNERNSSSEPAPDNEVALGIVREEVPKVLKRMQELRDIMDFAANLQAHCNKVIYELGDLEKELGLRRYDLQAVGIKPAALRKPIRRDERVIQIDYDEFE